MGKAKRLSETLVIVLGSKIAKQDFRSMDAHGWILSFVIYGNR